MKINLTNEELTLIVFALRPVNFYCESVRKRQQAQKLQKRLVNLVR